MSDKINPNQTQPTTQPSGANQQNTTQAVQKNNSNAGQSAQVDPTWQTLKQYDHDTKGVFCEIVFWFSIARVVLSLFGILFTPFIGVFIDVFCYWTAIRVLKTRKRGKAIAAIVLTSVAIVMTVTQLIIKAVINN